MVETVAMVVPVAAAGWAFLTWIFSGSIGLALVVFIVLKAMGR